MSYPAPRWGTPRRRNRPTHGPLLADVAALLGWDLFDWQRYAADVAMEYDPTTRQPWYRTVGIGVARQNGKTTLVVSRIALQLIIPGGTVAYTAQERNLARFKWAEHVDLLLRSPFADKVADVVRANGREQLVMRNGARYMIVTPGERAGRGLSLDLAVIDEAFAHDDMSLVGALAPTMVARPRAQLWVLSNAGTYRSALWRHYTDMGRALIADPESRMAWIEYAAEPGADLDDRRAWAEANPTLGQPNGVDALALADARSTLDEGTFRREHFNEWVDVAGALGIDPVAWSACYDAELRIGDDVALGIDFTPERDRGALVAAGPVGDRTALEVLEAGTDIDRIVRRAIEVARRWNAPIAVDRAAAAGSTIPALERAGITVEQFSLPTVVKACGAFHDAVVHGEIAHGGDYRLTDAVAGATRRRVGDAWAWQRRGGGDISPLVAATVARWSVRAGPEPAEPMIYGGARAA